MTSLLPISSTTLIYPLTFLYKSFADPVIQCRTISAYVLAGNNRSSSQREGELRVAPCHQALFRCEQVLRVLESSTTHKRYSWYASPELLSSLFPTTLCEDQTAPTSFSGGKKTWQFIYETVYVLSFSFHIYLELTYVLRAPFCTGKKRVVSIGSRNVWFCCISWSFFLPLTQPLPCRCSCAQGLPLCIQPGIAVVRAQGLWGKHRLSSETSSTL